MKEMTLQNTREFALQSDANDQLKEFRSKFFLPQHEGSDAVYFTGNSLGLQPKSVSKYIQQELDDWARLGVEGHFHAKNPWMPYHEIFPQQLSKIVGCKPVEVVVMNQLTVNLHLLMVSFYRPTKTRYKIICEARAFPSDQYAFESQARFHGFEPNEAVIEVAPRENENLIRHEDIISTIKQHGESVALVCFGGVNYYNGQFFDIASITKAAHEVGAIAGFDLAHAAGNVELKLHDWQVDFACWCSYKYLNSGPGGVGGIFVHQKHGNNPDTFRLGGWWGNDEKDRFKMEKGFIPAKGAVSWQMSNAPVFNMIAHKASLDIFSKTNMKELRKKSLRLTAYLEFLLQQIDHLDFEIITPKDPEQRGAQLSLLFGKKGREIFDALSRQGVIADWREPNVIRIAPVPLYNSFEDVYRFYEILNALKD